jgi:hypothetical protein
LTAVRTFEEYVRTEAAEGRGTLFLSVEERFGQLHLTVFPAYNTGATLGLELHGNTITVISDTFDNKRKP